MKNLQLITDNKALTAEAIDALKIYKQALDSVASAGTLETQVYHLLDSVEFQMAPHNYRSACVDFLAALSEPALAATLKESVGAFYSDFVKMIRNMVHFCDQIVNENFEIQLMIDQLENHGEEDGKLKEIIVEYTEKLKGVISYDRIKQLASAA